MELRRSLGAILNEVALQSHEIIIERAGKPLARITPLHTSSSESVRGKLEAIRSLQGMWSDRQLEIDPQEWVNQMRAEGEERDARLP
jgi:antitoxin (DNA-binding transcriptional repressor) of toxin-antitoxin stability system